ncbi:MAG: hypothetical protein WA891_04090 [Acidobacteriaceae bacterium]
MALAAQLPTVAERRSRLWGIPVYWHLLSLDAPTVAVLWAWSFARAAAIRPSRCALAVLGVGTWLLYVADRLLDSRSVGYRPLRERHFFHARHRGGLLFASAGALTLLLGLIRAMPPTARREDILVFAASMLYFATVHLPGLPVECWFPRELAVGVLFACATAVPAWSAFGPTHTVLALPVLLFAGLCFLNCLAIETWEKSAAPSPRRWVVPIAAMILALAAAVLMLIPELRSIGAFRLTLSTFSSAALLLILDQLHRQRTSRNPDPATITNFLLALRVAADAILLTPLLFVLPWHP